MRHPARRAGDALADWERAYCDFESPEEEIRKFEKRLHILGADRLPSSSRILEICCGRGGGLKAWHRLGFRRVVGLDLSEPLLRLYDGPASRVLGDVRAMPLGDASQDVIAVHGGLHHLRSLEDLEATLGEICRVVRPAGRIIVVEPWRDWFLTLLHIVCRQTIVRKISRRMDAFERMFQNEQATYEAWLSRRETIRAMLLTHLEPVVIRERWGKLMLLARRRGA